MKYIRDFVRHFKDRLAFSLRDCRVFLKQKKISRAYTHFLIHYLLKKGTINRIAKGVYSFSDDPIVSGFAFSPFYYGLQEALSLHGLWEQETNPVIITTRKIRPGLRKFLESNILVRRIDKKMFFGFQMINHFGKWVPVSDIEKTLIDFFYFRENIPSETLSELRNGINRKKMLKYLARVKPNLRKKMLAFLGNKGHD